MSTVCKKNRKIFNIVALAIAILLTAFLLVVWFAKQINDTNIDGRINNMQSMLVDKLVDESDVADSTGGYGGSGNIDFDTASSMDFEDDFDGEPISIPIEWTFLGCTSTNNGTTWSYETTEDVSDCAEVVLRSLESAGAILMESGYLDITNQSWGCAADMNDGTSALMITMIPEDRSNENSVLLVKVVVLNAGTISQDLFM